MEKETKIIFKPFLARQLLKMGNTIVDIKPKRGTNDTETVFVFEVTEKFKNDVARIIEEQKNR